MNRQLQKLRREELLEILLDLERENERIVLENADLKRQLASRELQISQAGTLADASLQLSGVFEAAQKSADMYVYNVLRLCVERARETDALCLDALNRSRVTSSETYDKGAAAQGQPVEARDEDATAQDQPAATYDKGATAQGQPSNAPSLEQQVLEMFDQLQLSGEA